MLGSGVHCFNMAVGTIGESGIYELKELDSSFIMGLRSMLFY